MLNKASNLEHRKSNFLCAKITKLQKRCWRTEREGSCLYRVRLTQSNVVLKFSTVRRAAQVNLSPKEGSARNTARISCESGLRDATHDAVSVNQARLIASLSISNPFGSTIGRPHHGPTHKRPPALRGLSLQNKLPGNFKLKGRQLHRIELFTTKRRTRVSQFCAFERLEWM